MIQTFEILAILFLLAMVYISVYSFKRNQLNRGELAFWIIVWVAAMGGIVFNKNLNSFLEDLSILRIFDLYTIIGFMFFLFMIFYLFRVVKKTERRVEEIVRVLAIKEMKRENGK